MTNKEWLKSCSIDDILDELRERLGNAEPDPDILLMDEHTLQPGDVLRHKTAGFCVAVTRHEEGDGYVDFIDQQGSTGYVELKYYECTGANLRGIKEVIDELAARSAHGSGIINTDRSGC